MRIRGAAEHNLRHIDVDIPRDRMVVITGVSGSGKSSLAFDTIYAEGQRRYVESLSAYARQFLEQMPKPDVERIEGLTPTIAIEQRSASANPRSTVATTTEIYDYMRLLWARVGEPHCPKCGRPITSQSAEEIVDRILASPEGARVQVLAVLVRGRKGAHKDVIASAKREGFVRLRIDKQVVDAREVSALDRKRKHEIEAVVDRLAVSPSIRSRLTDSVETALKLGEGLLIATRETEPGSGEWEDTLYSELYACPVCDVSFEELAPRMFSFNSPYGACEACGGLGTRMELDPDLIVPDSSRSLRDGAIEAWRRGGRRFNIFYHRVIDNFCRDFGCSPFTPFDKLSEEVREIMLWGTDEDEAERYGAEFEGVVPSLERRFETSDSDFVKRRIHEYMSALPCPACKGARLRPESLAVLVGGESAIQVTGHTIGAALEFFEGLRLTKRNAEIARPILKEIRERLRFLVDVGLAYLSLDRASGTLAGGEAQRLRLASQVGSRLVGVTYVLDEPTIGLHARDNGKLISTLTALRDLGNTVIVVEHDEEMIRAADHVLDLGPGAGAHGGRLVAEGSPDEIERNKDSLTGAYLSRAVEIRTPPERRPVHLGRVLTVKGARENNLKKIDVDFPLGVFTCVTGVSGSGKSTLVTETLYNGLARIMHRARAKPGAHLRILGSGQIDKAIEIDQSPIGKTPRSNPATYTGVFDEIRKLFARLPEAEIRGYAPGRFSFNVKGGRCEACEGQGTTLIEMHFLPDVYVRCDVCRGRRYNRETLEIRYRGKNIADVLDMSVGEAFLFFRNIPRIRAGLQTLSDVGLGYMALGQSSTTLSGGEAQRVKLSSELSKRETGRTLYVLDEPTTGLHFADISKLLDVLVRLIEKGNTVIVIEHNLDVIKTADWIVDLGPEGGDAGGRVVATGTPEQVALVPESYTGRFLARTLGLEAARGKAARMTASRPAPKPRAASRRGSARGKSARRTARAPASKSARKKQGK
ncbi:MAG: excinuclease ABC subunit UvrA [Planctomycetota bacterium]